GRLFAQLSQSGALHLCDDRPRQETVPGAENSSWRRLDDLLDAASRLAQPLRKSGGSSGFRAWGRTVAGAPGQLGAADEARDPRLFTAAVDGVFFARTDPPLQRRQWLLLEPLLVLSGVCRREQVPSRPGFPRYCRPEAFDRTDRADPDPPAG